MLIVCPSCLSAYRLPADAVETPPAAVRCAQCGKIFQAAEVSSAPLLSGSCLVPALPRAAPVPTVQRPTRSLPPPPAAMPTHRRPAAPLVFAVTAVVGLGSLACLGRARVVQALPQAAPVFARLGLPVSGLRLGEVATALGDEGPVKVLTLQTSITNTRSTDMRLPNVRIVVRDDAEQSVYSWTAPAPQAKLGPGEAVAFSSRLVSPPMNGHDLVVSFADGSGTPVSVGDEIKR